MPHDIPMTDPAAHLPRLTRTLWQWLVLGLLAVVAWPAARGDTWLLGALPFWLVAAPAVALAALHRHSLARRFLRAGPSVRRFRRERAGTRPAAGHALR